MNKTRWMPILIVIVIGIVLGGLILTLDKPATVTAEVEGEHVNEKPAEGQPGTGPRGGKLFTDTDFSVELTIFEKGVPPQFRIFLYEKGKLLPPAAANVAITLSRLGAAAQLFKFTPEADYLLGDHVVEEPHSFDIAITAEHDGKVMRWSYSQIEDRMEIADDMLKSMGVELFTAGPAIIKPKLKLPGEVIFNEHNIVRVVPRVAGLVTHVQGHHGQHVKKGDVLATIESPMLADLRSQYFVARKRLALTRTTYEREKQLWEEKISAKQDFLLAQELWNEAQIALELAATKLRALGVRPESNYSKTDFAHYEIRAPISGIIIAKAIALGEALKEDREIYTIADVSTVWTAITVYPKDLNIIHEGQKVAVKATASDIESQGTVTYISTLIGGQTRTATARVELDNKDGHWRPGMFVNAELVAEEIKVPVAVAAGAIQTLRDWPVVFGRYGQYFEARPLELGRTDGEMVEVLKGLTQGEQYAGGNSFALKAELGKAGASHNH
ncbi:MAG: efflux RND transporter periplasmic adaptor subunit [Nitrosomonas sp.]|uniref:efflux RND transporter periplasmic adaptor subunit n=1 Tax=Nitrosomonas sp. TaxID=42353 RepID=UPI0025E93219|nr:efflux RND transporter periplasmic adaptor subunit [Nitrosomonas sp.]UJP00558.1 MAG: efflux RND transporter periplasmic adaptor subunit [Nitrosomonas sp.]UJP02912.1 MAG: efflux RND transporter periplasmic adaptor subunit [Nitrosomonas sp.]UJP08406.1 MAG: efflux RND transporter periplasmic adaptor subunit [Nitrosomonas sp.]